MKEAVLVYPNQLFENHPALSKVRDIFLIEEPLFFSENKGHFQKLTLLRAAMKEYESWLTNKGYVVTYIEALEKTESIHSFLETYGIVHVCDVVDDYLEQRLFAVCGSRLKVHDTPLFLNTRVDVVAYGKDRKSFLLEDFYRKERVKRNILVDREGKPEGGRWNFDHDNRKKIPHNHPIPGVYFTTETTLAKEASEYIQKTYAFVGVPSALRYPYTFSGAQALFEDFLEKRFRYFGDFEDAMDVEESVLFHSILTPVLNIGLLTPAYVVKRALEYAEKNDIPLNATEGFIRQIIGWREFMRMLYVLKGREMRTQNHFSFERKVPSGWWSGSVGVTPIDTLLNRLMISGYAHHIERLMLLSNFMLLAEYHPDDVYRWFMEHFVDAYDWVMVPNVYGMGQFADGGIFATKPYISSSNYILKMSNYPKGEWCTLWDSLYWHFLGRHYDTLKKNHRMGLMLAHIDKKSSTEKDEHTKRVQAFHE